MKNITNILMAFFIVFMSGCSQKVTVQALEPAQIDRISQTKVIAVTDFTHDRVGLSRKIEAKLSNFEINNKKYFTVVSRNDINKVIAEQKLQNSGLVNDEKIVQVGELIGAQAIISGNVSPVTKEDSYFYEARVRCANRKCTELETYRVRCMKRLIGLSAEVRIVDVAKGDIIYADTLGRTSSFKHCADDSRAIPSKMMVAQKLADDIADTFIYKLTPHYRKFHVKLLEDPDLDYTDEQEKLLKISLKYIEQRRYDKAEKFLKELIDATNMKSYVAFYDLGVIKEAQGKYEEAKEYYEYADDLMIEPVEEINEAVVRINSLISKRKKTLEQLNR
ncbi:CsgG/HfaB family protein [Sulfurimonas sp. NW7]|uniref:CsgG/HfaB family protein n=1 Tax=Sulfurimonas sp. NW7 TaxID=2922727 RepID=UPI003DA9D46B